MTLIGTISETNRTSRTTAATTPLARDFIALLSETNRGALQIGHTPAPKKTGTLVAGPIASPMSLKIAESDPAAPVYTTKLPKSVETQRRYFSENAVPMNTVVVSHNTERDAIAGRAIVRALHEANPNGKIALLVQNYDKRDPNQLTELAKYYGLPESALAPIRVTGDTEGDGPIGLWPQDGFLAGAGGLYEPASGTQHAGMVAEAISEATGIAVENRDYLGMGGDIHFLTRPNGDQVAYFSLETVAYVMQSINQSRPEAEQLDQADPKDRILAIGHALAKINDAGVAIENVAPFGISPSGRTYGSVMSTMSPKQLAELRPDVLARLEEMRELPFPEAAPTNARRYDYHMDLMIASPDGVHAYVNSDDLIDVPSWREQLEFFGYKPVPLPASYERDNTRDHSNRSSYTNWIMGEVDGETVIILPTEAEHPKELTENDRNAIAAFQEHNPEVRIVPIGGNTTRMFANDPTRGPTRDWGAHCRTNVLPWILEPAPVKTSSEGAPANDLVAAHSRSLPERAGAF